MGFSSWRQNSLDRLVNGLLTLSQRYVMVTYFTNGDGVGERVEWGVSGRARMRVGRANRLEDGVGAERYVTSRVG